MKQCPCGSNNSYLYCCGLYISEQAIPKTPEALMRSRYTAYSIANIEYIKKTMQGRPLINFNEREASRWASKIVWIGLKIINSSQDDCEKHIGFVEFIAAYLEKDNLKTIHEHSQFQRTNDHWFYIEGQMISTLPKKISRNAPCPCGSQKKFKNCHALN